MLRELYLIALFIPAIAITLFASMFEGRFIKEALKSFPAIQISQNFAQFSEFPVEMA